MSNFCKKEEQMKQLANELLEEMENEQSEKICPFLSSSDKIIYCVLEKCACYDRRHIECAVKSMTTILEQLNG